MAMNDNNGRGKSFKKQLILCASATALMIGAANAAVANDHNGERHFEIKAQDVNSSLLDLAAQSEHQIIFSSSAVEGLEAPALDATMTPEDAANYILGGSSLTVDKVSEKTLVVKTRSASLSGERYAMLAVTQDDDQEEEPTIIGSDDDSDAEDDEDDVVIVTGTRIKGVSPTTQTVVIDKAEIDARGFRNVEDIINSLPQTYGDFSSNANALDGFNNGVNGSRAAGQAAANIRGLGASNVLVLVNGRRQSNSTALSLFSTDESLSAVNLNTIPFAAIERVEIILDGASALYGADAVGGVINFILRTDFNGGEVSARLEDGPNTGIYGQQYSGVFGKTWKGGFLTASASWTNTDSVSNSDIGFTTNDLRDRDPVFGFDQRFYGSPFGIHTDSLRFRAPLGWLGEGDSGGPITAADIDGSSGRLSTNVQERLIDDIPPQLLPESKNLAFTLNFEQDLFADLTLLGGFSFARDRTIDTSRVPNSDLTAGQFHTNAAGDSVRFVVPDGTPFNQSGEDLFFSGRLPPGINAAVPNNVTTLNDRRIGGNLGFEYRFLKDWTATAIISRDQSETSASGNRQIFDEAAFGAAVASGEVNPFADLASNPAMARFVMPSSSLEGVRRPVRSVQTQITLDLEGPLFELPGGTVRIAAGGEARWEKLNLDDFFLIGNGNNLVSFDFPINEPTRDLLAVYGEINIPLVGANNSFPLMHSFSVNLSGRFDKYSANAETENDVIDNEYDAFSPQIGIAWRPFEPLKIRANWSESFRAPSLRQLFRADSLVSSAAGGRFLDPDFFINIPFDDEFFPSDDPGPIPPFLWINSANNELRGESSETWSLGADLNMPGIDGLNFSVNYNHTVISDAFSSSNLVLRNNDAFRLVGPDGFGTLVRDDRGYIVQLSIAPVNISSVTNESIDFYADWQIDSGFGDLLFTWRTSHPLEQSRILIENVDGIAAESTLGTDRGQARWNHVATAAWRYENWAANIAATYTGEYVNMFQASRVASRAASDGGRRSLGYLADQVTPVLNDDGDLVQQIDSHLVIDVSAEYYFQDSGFRILAGALNVFDNDPPFFLIADQAPFDPAKHNPLGRRLFVKVTKEF